MITPRTPRTSVSRSPLLLALAALVVGLVGLAPRSARAAGSTAVDEQYERARKLTDLGQELHDTCSLGDHGVDREKPKLVRALEAALEDAHPDEGFAAGSHEALAEAALGQDPPDLTTALAEAKQSSVAALKDKATKMEAALANLAGRADTCDTYCRIDPTQEPSAGLRIDVCAFRSDDPSAKDEDGNSLGSDLAMVAAAVDGEGVDSIIGKIGALGIEAATGGADRTSPLSIPTSVAGLTSLGVDLATALGKLAIDRAKQEAVLWALGEVGDRFCGNDDPSQVATAEIRTYWLPRLCRLASEENLQSGFGAGQAMLKALVSAVEQDARHMPGAAAGLLVGVAYWSEDQGSLAEASGALACSVGSAPASAECERLAGVRTRTADAVTELLEGADAIAVARTWSAEIDEINRVPLAPSAPAGDRVLEAPLAQLVACGVAVAAELGSTGTERTILIAEGKKDLALRYHLLAALTAAPACWTITGRGVDLGDTTLALEHALDRTTDKPLERVSTVARVGTEIEQSRQQAREAWRQLEAAVARLRDARRRLTTAAEKLEKKSRGDTTEATLAAIAKLDPSQLELSDLRALLGEAQLDRVEDRISAALDLAEELLAAVDAMAELLEAHSSEAKLEALFPGLQVRSASDPQGARERPAWLGRVDEVRAAVEAFRGQLERIDALIDALRKLLEGDWATATTEALTVARGLIPHTTEAMTAAASKHRAAVIATIDLLQTRKDALEAVAAKSRADLAELDAITLRLAELHRVELSLGLEVRSRRRREADVTTRLAELIGVFSAILSAEDTDDIAAVLEKTASPPGSWRRKQAPGSFTLSLGSHVGVYGAFEVRWGQYGVFRERGTHAWQAPTLSVPIGLDFAWGTGRNSLGFFLPFIDPAAFVQYDVNEGGRLPGPRPVTVLSPGAMLRWGIFRTPITLLAGYVFRPRLRTWDATVNEPGADAHQIGLSLAIDATFWNIVKR